MTDLSKVLEAVKNSKVVLDAEFWDAQNKQIHENQKRFAEEARNMRPTQELLQREFDI